jgi:transposase-like protein
MVVQMLLCQHCGSDRIVRNGRAPNGKQRFLCRTCGRQCRQNPSPRGYTEAEREQILRAYQERSSLRGLQRTFGVAPATVVKWLKKSPKPAASERHGGRTIAGQRGPSRA